MKISEFEQEFGINLAEDCEANLTGCQYYTCPDGTKIVVINNGTRAVVQGTTYELEPD